MCEVSYRKKKTDDGQDSESIAEEASVGTKESLTKELKIAEADFKVASDMIADNPKEFEPIQDFVGVEESVPETSENPPSLSQNLQSNQNHSPVMPRSWMCCMKTRKELSLFCLPSDQSLPAVA